MRKEVFLIFSILLVGLMGAAPLLAQQCPPTGVIKGSLNSSDPTKTVRVFRDGNASQCTPPKVYPGPFPGGGYYVLHEYKNVGDEAACVTVNFYVGSCNPGFNAFASAWLSGFDPTNTATWAANYLGDLGCSDSQPFSFIVPANETFIIMVENVFGPVECVYGMLISGLPCQVHPVPAVSGWGVALLVVIVGLASLYSLRRLRRT